MMAEQPVAARETIKPRRRFGLVALPLIIFGLLAIVFGLALVGGDPSKLPSALIGKPAPVINLPPVPQLVNVDGTPVAGFTTSKLAQGKPTVVNFWASWCVPCVQEHPLLVEIGKATGVAVHGVNYKDQPDAARRFLGRYGNPYASVGQDLNGRAAIEWGVYGMPETFVVDGKGTIVYKHVGPITPESLKARVIPAIEKAKTSGG
jgi:cytochrome c biogenesis protein CcmG/thiol:disulfide interchange protein DsbE